MLQRIRAIAGIVLTLVTGNVLLTAYLVHILETEGTERLAVLRQGQEDEIVAEVRGRVDTAFITIRHIQGALKDTAEAQKAAMAVVNDIRFGEDNYLWIHRLDPNDERRAFMLVHPADTLRGRDNAGLIDLDRITHLYHEGAIVPKDDPRVKYIRPIDLFAAFNRIALTRGEGIVSYYWPKIVRGQPTREGYRKVAFIKYLPEWNWVIGAGAYADAVDDAIKERAAKLQREHERLVWSAAGGMFAFSVTIVFIVATLSWRLTRQQIVRLKAEVAERKRAEDALRKVSLLQEAILKSAGYAIIATTPEGTITTFNPAAEDMLGYGSEELIGLETPSVFHDHAEMEARAVELAAEFGIPKPSGPEVFFERGRRGLKEEREWTYIRKDGSRIPVLLTITAMSDADGEIQGFLGIAVDISGRKQTEEQLRQALKMESVGRLAAGVAHDLNNLLTPILGYSELLSADMPDDDVRQEQLNEITRAAERARDLVRQLLSFGRKQILQLRRLDLNQVITGIERLVRRTLREDIALRVVLNAESCPILADIGQIEQIVMNLMINAQDAMPEGGTLTIASSRVVVDEAYATTIPDIVRGRYCLLRVSDTGQGIAPEALNKIFEPFYSTKGELGTGLGLATVYGVVRQHGGSIAVHSTLGSGTVFEVFLSEAEEASAPASTLSPASRASGGSETILIVEDNQTVSNVVSAALKKHGYRVLNAQDGRAALQVLREHRGPIHLLLTDVVMPEMNGKELASQATKQRAELRVLFMSGYPEDAIGHRGVLEAGIDFIAKPFSIDALLAKVHGLLQRNAPSDSH